MMTFRSNCQKTMNTQPITLYCLPYAGGNAFFYRPLVQCVPSHIQGCPLELPGRGRRSREALCVSMEALVDDLFRQIMPICEQGRYALFGHSMGAILSYLLTQRIERAGLVMPETLFLSGAAAPMAVNGQARHLLPRDAFFDMLRELGGCPPEVLNEPDLLDYFEPILRADFQAIDTWQPRAHTPLAVPFVMLGGDQDAVDQNDLQAWQTRTRAGFQMYQFEGGHFFIQQHWQQIATIVGECLTGRPVCHAI